MCQGSSYTTVDGRLPQESSAADQERLCTSKTTGKLGRKNWQASYMMAQSKGCSVHLSECIHVVHQRQVTRTGSRRHLGQDAKAYGSSIGKFQKHDACPENPLDSHAHTQCLNISLQKECDPDIQAKLLSWACTVAEPLGKHMSVIR